VSLPLRPLSFESPSQNHNCRPCGGFLTDPPLNYPSVSKYEPAFRRSRRHTVPLSWESLLILLWSAKPLTARFAGLWTICCNCSSPSLGPLPRPQTKRDNRSTLPTRQSPPAMIDELIAKAAPSSDTRVHGFRYRQSLKAETICLARSQSLMP